MVHSKSESRTQRPSGTRHVEAPTRLQLRTPGSLGFTLIELLVVIGIMAVLLAITILGLKYAGNPLKGTANQATMGALRSALAEAETAGLFRRQPNVVYSNGTGSPFATATVVNNKLPDLWKNPDPNSTATDPLLYSPGLLTPDNEAVWSQSPLLKNTAIALGMMKNVPAVNPILDALANNVNKSATFYSGISKYPINARVIYATSATALDVYIATANQTTAAAPPSGVWQLSWAAVLDNSGNPIVFVPASGLHIGKAYVTGQTYNPGDRVYVAASGRTYYECTSTTSANPPGTGWRIASPIRDPAGKPFWASAGPDGDLDTNADNQYSFQQ